MQGQGIVGDSEVLFQLGQLTTFNKNKTNKGLTAQGRSIDLWQQFLNKSSGYDLLDMDQLR